MERIDPPPRKKAKIANAVDENDQAALNEIVIENVPESVLKVLREAATELNLADLQPRNTQFGPTKRT